MKNRTRRIRRSASLGLLAALVGATTAAGVAMRGKTGASMAKHRRAATSPRTPESIIGAWPKRERLTARLMLEKYGRPGQFDRNSLVWFNKGEWKRTIVYRTPLGGRAEHLQQTIAYPVPDSRVAALKSFDPMMDVSRTAGEIGFASESEEKNRLALNLADEIATGRKTVPEARAFFDKISDLAQSGKSSSYLTELRFDVDNTRFMTPSGADR